ncbi:MAG: DinB family protein [Dehalococcoidia bacterium]
MDARIAEIREVLAQNFEATNTLLGSLSPEDLGRTAGNGWMVSQLAGHVAAAPGGAVWLTSRLRRGRGATVPGFLSFIPAMRNWMQVRRLKQATPGELLATAKGAYERLMACVNTLKDEELDRGGVMFGVGQQSVYQFLSTGVSNHAEEHRAEIRSALGRA